MCSTAQDNSLPSMEKSGSRSNNVLFLVLCPEVPGQLSHGGTQLCDVSEEKRVVHISLFVAVANITSVFRLLPSCDSCLLLNINSTGKNFRKLLDKIKFSSDVAEDDINAHSLYLMSRESTLQDSDLEHFKQQARCLGFSGEPDFLYDPKNEFCAEGEGIKLTSDSI